MALKVNDLHPRWGALHSNGPQLDIIKATCSLKCPTGTVIVIKDAFWGKDDKKICRHILNKELKDWDTNCGTSDWDRHKTRGAVQYM